MEKAIEAITDGYKDLAEIVKERVFSPMYFYFIIAWVITNWKFSYSLVFLAPEFIYETEKISKITYLTKFYSAELWWPLICSASQLLIIPAASTFFIVWCLSKASEKFYEKTEKHKQNKRAIKKAIEYTEEKVVKLKLNYAREAFEKEENVLIKKIDNASIAYKDNDEFNSWFDDTNGDKVEISNLEFYKSEILYYTDFEAYKWALNEWRTAKEWKLKVLAEKKTNTSLSELVEYIDYLTDAEAKGVFDVVIKAPSILNDETRDVFWRLYEKKSYILNDEEKWVLEKLINNVS